MAIVLVTATTSTEDSFPNTQIGKSIATHAATVRPRVRVFYENSRSLSACYNQAIDEASDNDILVFVHDDALITDFFWAVTIRRGLKRFDILGVAGNRRRLPMQPGWAIVDEDDTRDAPEFLTGVVGHGSEYPCKVTQFGPVPAACKLLDGVLLVARKSTLDAHGIRFDERFDFDFYDLDFCRQAEVKELTMGTVPIGLLHSSEGQFFTPRWKANYARYLEKWRD